MYTQYIQYMVYIYSYYHFIHNIIQQTISKRRRYVAAVALHTKIYVVGGYDGKYFGKYIKKLNWK